MRGHGSVGSRTRRREEREGDDTAQQPNFVSFALNAREFMGRSERLYA